MCFTYQTPLALKASGTEVRSPKMRILSLVLCYSFVKIYLCYSNSMAFCLLPNLGLVVRINLQRLYISSLRKPGPRKNPTYLGEGRGGEGRGGSLSAKFLIIAGPLDTSEQLKSLTYDRL